MAWSSAHNPNDVETKGEHFRDQTKRNRAWSYAELEAVRDAARALVRTRSLVDLPGKRAAVAFDGNVLWELIGALDRTNPREDR